MKRSFAKDVKTVKSHLIEIETKKLRTEVNNDDSVDDISIATQVKDMGGEEDNNQDEKEEYEVEIKTKNISKRVPPKYGLIPASL